MPTKQQKKPSKYRVTLARRKLDVASALFLSSFPPESLLFSFSLFVYSLLSLLWIFPPPGMLLKRVFNEPCLMKAASGLPRVPKLRQKQLWVIKSFPPRLGRDLIWKCKCCSFDACSLGIYAINKATFAKRFRQTENIRGSTILRQCHSLYGELGSQLLKITRAAQMSFYC